MGAYILRRLAYSVLILAGVNLLPFTLFFAIDLLADFRTI